MAKREDSSSSNDGSAPVERNFYLGNQDPGQTVACAHIKGGPLAPQIRGIVMFKPVPSGTEVCVQVKGLPAYQPGHCNTPPIGPHGFHIHIAGNCDVGDPNNPFQKAGEHWNPTNQPHGNHAGDLPVLFSNHGKACMTVFTDRFTPSEVVGKAVIIHLNPDDYRTQPAGDSGKRAACGVIRMVRSTEANLFDLTESESS